MIELEGISRKYGNTSILNGLDLKVQPGECLAVLGINGAGKTTLLRMIATLLKPHTGSIKIAGYLLPKDSDMARLKIGVVFHDPMLYGELTAVENLKYFSDLYLQDINNNSIEMLIERVGLGQTKHKRVKSFSRGMQQRLAIARAIVHTPDILLLDEPFTSLDDMGCELVRDIVREFREADRCVVITSHDINRLEDSATRYGILDKGKIRITATSSELKSGSVSAWYQQGINKGNESL